jgi:hypothetical protein
MQTQDACIGWIISLVDAADPDAVRLSLAEADAYLVSFDDLTGMAARRADLIAALRQRPRRTALADEVIEALAAQPTAGDRPFLPSKGVVARNGRCQQTFGVKKQARQHAVRHIRLTPLG